MLSAAGISLAVIGAWILSPLFMSAPKEALANNPNFYLLSPRMSFTNPKLISGTAGKAGAVYRFSNVATASGKNVDAWITLVKIYNNAVLQLMDCDTAGYNAAWQPFVVAASNDTSYIDWKINFKRGGTSIDTTLTLFSITAIDVDGNGSKVREMVAASPAFSMSKATNCNLNLSFNGITQTAISGYPMISSIDTNQQQAMFQMNFMSATSVNYRTGAINEGSSTSIRHNAIFFQPFFQTSSPLPVSLGKFQAEVTKDNQVNIQWTTQSEKNNDYFTVERSHNGTTFEEVIRVKGSGNSTSEKYYSAIDAQPLEGTSFYRLKQTDFNGDSETFNAVKIFVEKKRQNKQEVKIFPNPFSESFTAGFVSEKDEEVSVRVISLDGKVVYSESYPVQTGDNQLICVVPQWISPGNYMLHLSNARSILASAKIVRKPL